MLNTIGENPHRVLKVREAASFIASTKSWLDKSRLTGAGPPFVRIGTGIGARVGYRLCDLQNWLATRVRSSTTPAAVRVDLDNRGQAFGMGLGLRFRRQILLHDECGLSPRNRGEVGGLGGSLDVS